MSQRHKDLLAAAFMVSLILAFLWIVAHPSEAVLDPEILDHKMAVWELDALTIELHDLNGPYESPRGRSASNSSPVAPAPRPVLGEGVEQWRDLVTAAFTFHGIAHRIEEALLVMACESNGNPNAANPISSADGLFQHLDAFRDRNAWRLGVEWYDKFDPHANTWVTASVVADDGGWRQWSCKRVLG